MQAIKTMLLATLAWAIWMAPPAQAEEPVTIAAFGDSLMAGYGLDRADGFAAQLQDALDRPGRPVRVIDASVSGDTTAGGRARLDWTLADAPDLVLLGLGANDFLRGIDPAVTRDNLDAMLARLAERDMPVLLLGMLAPRSLGPDYVADFDAIYPALAETHGVPLVPFLLEGVATDPALNQRDGIHPNAQGVARMVETVAPAVEEALEHMDGR